MSSTRCRVYPRVYGESSGLRADRGDRRRSIPACTGNPATATASVTGYKVYPRVYGESPSCLRRSWSAMGLSPRVRGIPVADAGEDHVARSIPACTGNPRPDRYVGVLPAVYPRVYGESPRRVWATGLPRGLSPRVRGIRQPASATIRVARSIPACTGNPPRPRPARVRAMVYPRVYGESAAGRPVDVRGEGLSPRVRGIHRETRGLREYQGSIPACTGNPSDRPGGGAGRGVYPRVYGESSIAYRVKI